MAARYHTGVLASLILYLATGPAFAAGTVDWKSLSRPGVVEKYLDQFLTEAKADPKNAAVRILGAEFAYFAWRLEQDPKKRLTLATTCMKLAKEATQLAPDHPGGWYWYGSGIALFGLTRGVLNSLQLVPEGRKAIDKSIELDPNYRDGMAQANLGRLYMVLPGFPLSMGDIEKAASLLTEGVKKHPDSSYYPLYLADMYWSLGANKQALHWAEQTLKRKPSNDYSALMTPINQRKARELIEAIKGGQKRDRFNDVLSDHGPVGIVN